MLKRVLCVLQSNYVPSEQPRISGRASTATRSEDNYYCFRREWLPATLPRAPSWSTAPRTFSWRCEGYAKASRFSHPRAGRPSAARTPFPLSAARTLCSVPRLPPGTISAELWATVCSRTWTSSTRSASWGLREKLMEASLKLLSWATSPPARAR